MPSGQAPGSLTWECRQEEGLVFVRDGGFLNFWFYFNIFDLLHLTTIRYHKWLVMASHIHSQDD